MRKFPPAALILVILLSTSSCSLFKSSQNQEKEKAPKEAPTITEEVKKRPSEELISHCLKSLKSLPGKYHSEKLINVCKSIDVLPSCLSVKKEEIFHFNSNGSFDPPIKILVFAIVHGDEALGGAVTRTWMERLTEISPRNDWRIIPILNPDGMKKRSRTNANGVDINRNFPTKNWDKESLRYWTKRIKKNKRKYPGPEAASEPETQCAIAHIQDYKPDLIIAVHTPLGILDFDGPKVKYPKGTSFPWIRLGHYPGSLGRYMWRDNKTPVLTIELKGDSFIKDIGNIDKLQDMSGLLAIMATQEIEKEKKVRN